MSTPQPLGPPAGYASRPPLHPRATASMTLGIIGLAGCIVLLPLLVSPLAWYYGALADRESERQPDRWRRGSEARTGMITGMIGTALLALLLMMLLVVGALTVLGSRYDAGYGT